jgi:signal transduction histidine kinase
MSETNGSEVDVVAGGVVEGEGPRALVVDDNEAQMVACMRILASHGYRVESARDGEAALGALRRTAFDVLVSDIQMPNMSGVELVGQMRTEGIDVPVVLITGDPTLESAIKAMDHGVLRYLTKPLTPGPFVLAVNTVVRLHGLARVERLARDNDALRSLIEELRRSKDAALAGERAKTVFLTKIGHELRTPMSGILGFTDLALHTEPPPEAREYLERIKTAATSLMEVLADILEVSAMTGGRARLEPKPFSLRDVIDATLKPLLRFVDAKGLSLTTDIGSGVPDALLGDPARFGQIVKALVGNAIKFTKVGEVRVCAHLEARLGSEVCVCVSISDTGIGISPQDLLRVLEPFAQQDDASTRRYGGAGLGLTIASQLVALMKGTLKIESTPGVGTTVRVAVCFERVPAEDAFFVMDSYAGRETPGAHS